MKFHLLQILIAIDQLVNTIFGGWADETMSSRCWRAEQRGLTYGKICRPLIDAIFFFDKNHCEESYYSELNRMQEPPALRRFPK